MADKMHCIGQLGKSFGVKGYNRISVFDEFLDVAYAQSFLFLEEEDYHVPYRVDHWNQARKEVRFTDIKRQEQADQIQNKKIFLPTSLLNISDQKNLIGLEGFMIFNGVQEVGEIVEIRELPQQLLAIVEFNNKEVMIPLHESLIVDLDAANKKIHMNLPEGILDL